MYSGVCSILLVSMQELYSLLCLAGASCDLENYTSSSFDASSVLSHLDIPTYLDRELVISETKLMNLSKGKMRSLTSQKNCIKLVKMAKIPPPPRGGGGLPCTLKGNLYRPKGFQSLSDLVMLSCDFFNRKIVYGIYILS